MNLTCKSPRNGQARTGLSRAWPALLMVSLTLGGCDEAGDSSTAPALQALELDELDESAEPMECVSLFDSNIDSLEANLPPAQMGGFDFDTGNAAIELVIPAIVPVLFAEVAPGDATIVLRFTTLATNSWFDATAPYHPTAVGVYSDLGRRPASESLTNAQMNTALLYSSHRVLSSLAPHAIAEWDAVLLGVGLDPTDVHESTTDAIGIGNAAGNAIVAARENDGFNQLGFDDGRIYNPQPYSDYTGFKPKNTAYKLKDARKWQPQLVHNRYGIARVQAFVTPQYALTTPYSYDDPHAFSSPKPKKSYASGPQGNLMYRQQADEVLAVSANLTDEQKVIAELFDDKIRSLGFSGVFAALSQNLSLLEFVHYDFAASLAAFDTGIVIWQEKTRWNAVRPFSAIAKLYGDDELTAWGGPFQGTVNDITGDEWSPYLQTADHPEYPSASASFCAAHAEISRMFLGSDDLNWTVPIPAGSSQVEPGLTPAAAVDVEFETWTQFETNCGDSRIWAGVHFADSVPAGQDIGHEIAQHAYDFVQAHIDGNAP